MRKYDKKNKMYFIMVLVLSIILIIIFSFFLNKVITNAKLNYEINAGSIMYDKDKNLFRIDEDATLKKKWNDTYFLTYKDDLINLGLNAIIYNPAKSQMNLYGRFYEIAKDYEDKVIIHDDETLVNVNDSKFYKIADRKYLLVDKTIKGQNNEVNATNYLIVELDTQGNALLYNNNINLKTFKETTLVTSTYSFIIAEEKLIIGNEEIDLKKIIGSTNKYIKAEEIEQQQNNNNQSNNNNNTNNNIIPNRSATKNYNSADGIDISDDEDDTENQTNNNQTDNTNNNDNNNDNSGNSGEQTDNKDNIIKATKTTSIIGVTADVGFITVDYVIYDPLEEYESVFAEIYDADNNLVAVNYFDKTNNKLIIPGLRANVVYNLVFKYSYYDQNNRVEREFDRSSVLMSSPNLSVKITKVTSNRIYYTVNLDKDYKLDSLKVNLNSGSTSLTNTITNPANSTVEGYFEYDKLGNQVNIYLSNVIYKGYTINTNASYKIAMP